MTQQKCAPQLGLPRLAVLRIERGYRRIRLPELERICDAVGCTAEELLGDAGLANAAARTRLYGAGARRSAAALMPVFSQYYQAEQARPTEPRPVVRAAANR